MRLTYFGHSAFQLDDGENTVLIDPFLTGNGLTSQDPDALSPGTILLTHAHDDHVGDTVAIATRCGAAVIATFELANWVGSQGVPDVRPGNHGGTVRFDGGSAKFTPAWHTSSRGDGTAPGVPAGLVVRFGGKTIYFAGDTCLFGDMALIADENLDIAVLPIGDTFTMGPIDAAKAARLLRAPVVIPCHFNTFPPIERDPGEFKAAVETDPAIRCLVLDPDTSTDV